MTDLALFRARKDEFFARHPHSPLTREQKRKFQGLQYYPENADLRLEVEVAEFEQKDEVQMPLGIRRHRLPGPGLDLLIVVGMLVSGVTWLSLRAIAAIIGE